MTSLAAFQQDFLTLITCSDEPEKDGRWTMSERDSTGPCMTSFPAIRR